ncbi:unnamed protein product [Miscanthus lutarioriparius]|uniref:Uncharacterized protein n=1 Tax=Miscanthus lutarioriparius TaxID=422564 RepID=A0A811RD64_9POAL|nr:unnamed protein product [Miscanthus lutarioriparius]
MKRIEKYSSASSTIYQYHHEDGEDSDTSTDGGNDSNGAGEDEDVEALDEAMQAEQLLPSGDFYQGDLRGDLPHGAGKFLWTDGSMYEGACTAAARRATASSPGPPVPPTRATSPSQKILTWPGVEAMQKKSVWRPPKVSLDQGRRFSVSRRSSASLDLDILQAAAEGGESEEARTDRSCLQTLSCMRTPPRPRKKQGETISKGHRNYELSLASGV